jgi:non-specific serine/threonine protein kinase/serine/threonine-protein kinase
MIDRSAESSAPLDPNLTRADLRPVSGPETIGPYRLLMRVGEGGMGEVWLAEQTRPVRRQVALKVIKAGMDTAYVVTRFEAERQALAMMDHPAIAKVFDAGVTPKGRPYFVLEYVRGEPITTYCARQRLSTDDRLDLFLQVCDGVQHAHQKGIIHRDLKPSNILVTLLDGRPVPKIIDFGVAKAIAQPLTDRTLYTELGMLVGTPEYMSPEQAEMTGLDIDTRTDVYALGVILYELLTGVLPLDPKGLREKGLDEIRRTIREVDPPRPSVRLTMVKSTGSPSTPGADVTTLRELRGDLDWITMRALEKDRTRRYGSAAELATDVRRHLSHLPVVAGPPSTLYRTRKFVRRHRVGVAVAATLVGLLVAFATTTAIQARRIARERDRASQEAAIATTVNDFLQSDLLAQASASQQAQPDIRPDPDLKVRTALDRAAARIEGKFEKQPLVEASIRQTIGTTYSDLGLYAEARPHLERSLEIRRRVLGLENPDTVRSMWRLAKLHALRQEYEPARTLYQETVEIQGRILGVDHPDRLETMQDLGWLMAMRGQLAEGEKLVVEALTRERRILGNDHPLTLTGIHRLANVMMNEGRYTDEEKLAREEWERRRRIQGAEHPQTVEAERFLAGSVLGQGRLVEAEQLQRDTLAIKRRVLGADHPDTASSMSDLGNVLRREGHSAEAATLYLEAIDTFGRALGPESSSTLMAVNNLGLVYLEAHRYPEAEKLFSDLLPKSRRVNGAQHRRTLMAMNNLAVAYAHEQRQEDAIKLLRDTIAISRTALGENHPITATFILSLSEAMALVGHREDALASLEEAVNHGYRDADNIASDDDLKSLRGDPRFEAILTALRAAPTKTH